MQKHIHILGICGTFMGGIALLARELGFRVTGSDANVYPPMSTQLEAQGIELMEGYLPEHLQPAPDCVIVGNALSRGSPAVEYALNSGIPYTSGPQWLAENVLQGKWVLAVSGTHGKTTSSSMLAWILEYAGMSPGFLIGGVPGNFGYSARVGNSDFFVVEADEYDTAFFDKRSKFVHYRPRTLCINNLEFDHADIFDNLAAIQRQFHHLVRCVPGEGQIIHPKSVAAVEQLLEMGCWTPTRSFAVDAAANWSAQLISADGSHFSVVTGPGSGPGSGPDSGSAPGNDASTDVQWPLCGLHNVENALCAMAAAHHVGVPVAVSAEALAGFHGVKRRLELLGTIGGVAVFDDFAHHPTAIATTLQGLRARGSRDQGGKGRLIALIEPRSNTMRMGEHRAQLAAATGEADQVFWFQPPGMDWSLQSVIEQSPVPAELSSDLDDLIGRVTSAVHPGDQIVIMSNGGFGGIHQKLLAQLPTT